jgi:tyrosine-protein phosphatase SIW14
MLPTAGTVYQIDVHAAPGTQPHCPGEAPLMGGNRKLRVRRVRAGILSCLANLVFLAPLVSTSADEYPGGEPPAATKQSSQNNSMHKNLPNFGEATTTLYHGGQPSKTGFRMLARMGVSIVVDLRGSRDSERKIVTHLGMQYVAMPWECSFPKDKVFAEFLTLLRKNPGKKIFVHCRLGDDRTAMMIASYRMAEEGWSAERAKLEMEKFGFSFAHRNLICPGLSSYEEKFPHEFKTSPAFRSLR